MALCLDIFTSVKSRDFNLELLTISTDFFLEFNNFGNFMDWNLKEFISIGIQFHRKGIVLLYRKGKVHL
jgi:hypothetical protein